jgi:glycosyltransferase involved in cell wall biosynthesis
VLRTLLRIKSPPLVILAFSYKGIATHFTWLSRQVMRRVDRITVLSPAEPAYYSKMLDYPVERISLDPLGWYDMFPDLDPARIELGDFIFSSGRSYRDYATLCEAIKGVDYPLVVNARQFSIQGLEWSTNVKINDFMPTKEFNALMLKSRFVVVPLQYTQHAAGEGHIIQAMSAGKALVATRTPSSESYIEDGKTGILVEPYNPEAMRNAIHYLLQHPEEVRAMGERARHRFTEQYTFTAFAERTYRTLQNVIARSKA